MIVEKINLVTEDSCKLFGMLYRTYFNNSFRSDMYNETEEVVIMVHGCTSSCTTDRNDTFALELMKNNIDYFCFNNRGNGIISKVHNVNSGSLIIGSACENILDSNFDIIAAVDKMIELGYKKIHLLGHSLGCTKVIYWYSKLKQEEKEKIDKYIVDIGFLSLVDVKESIFYGDREKYTSYAREQVLNGKGKSSFMPLESFITLVTCEAYLYYSENLDNYNFVNYLDKNYNYEMINSISKDIFIRYGEIKEILPIELNEVITRLKDKINVNNDYTLDIGYIEGANHSYHGKEKEVINQYINFIKR